MKKTAALLLALIMLLSLFAACGEKAPGQAADGTASAPAGEDISAPADSDDEENTDKETTEITAPDAPVIIATDPSSPSDGGQQTAQSSGQQTTQPSGQTAQGGQSPSGAGAPSQTTQTPASSLRGLIPASGKLEDPKDWKEEHTVLFFGDGFISANQMGDMFIMLAEADGIKINCPANFTYNTIGSTNTFNLYSQFSFDGENADSKITGPKSTWMKCSFNEVEKYNFDMFICQVSRDRSLASQSSRGRCLTSMEYFTREMNKIHPGFKTVHLAPAGFL
ncbi:MAG: hypothetical protein IJS65_04385, partial [Clostridia bacterium]|nr:hypothetical protein [Clostridia bacterium]